MPKVSVIIPVYNVEKYLSRCLDSLIKQTFSDWEAIIVDDGSTDNSSKIITTYSQQEKRIIMIEQKNQGLSIARNNGLKKAQGKYIYFLDSDDQIHPQLLEIAVDFAEKYKSDLISFRHMLVSENFINDTKDIIIDKSKIQFKTTNNPLFFGCKGTKYSISFNVWNKLYAKSLLKNISFIPRICFEDVPFIYTVLSKKPKTILLDERLYYYLQREDSITKRINGVKYIKDHFFGLQEILKIYSNKSLKKELAFLKRDFIPVILHEQFKKCKKENNDEMFSVFKEELKYLKELNLIGFLGYKLKHLYTYLKLIRNNQ